MHACKPIATVNSNQTTRSKAMHADLIEPSGYPKSSQALSVMQTPVAWHVLI